MGRAAPRRGLPRELGSRELAELLGVTPANLRQLAHRNPALRALGARKGRAVRWQVLPVLTWWWHGRQGVPRG